MPFAFPADSSFQFEVDTKRQCPTYGTLDVFAKEPIAGIVEEKKVATFHAQPHDVLFGIQSATQAQQPTYIQATTSFGSEATAPRCSQNLRIPDWRHVYHGRVSK